VKKYLPDYMISAFAAQGIDTSKLIYAIHTDSGPDSGDTDVYTAVDEEKMYILYGTEKVVKTTGARRIVAVYEPAKIEKYSFSQLGELTCERLLSTGRLISEKEGDTRILLAFSIGYL